MGGSDGAAVHWAAFPMRKTRRKGLPGGGKGLEREPGEERSRGLLPGAAQAAERTAKPGEKVVFKLPGRYAVASRKP